MRNPGIVATAMHCVNAVPYVCEAAPGLASYLELPLIAGRAAHERHCADYIAIARLHAAYGDAVTRRAWDEMAHSSRSVLRSRSTPLGVTLSRSSGGAEMVAFVARLRSNDSEFFEFVPLNTVLSIDAGRRHGDGSALHPGAPIRCRR